MRPLTILLLLAIALACAGASALEPEYAKGKATVAAVNAAPDTLRLELTVDTGRVTCTPTNQFGAALALSCGWSSKNAAVARVLTASGTGTSVVGVAVGATWVVATAKNKRDSVRVIVSSGTPPPAVVRAVSLTPSSATLDTGATRQFTALDSMTDGTTKPYAGPWSATGGTISAAGLYTAGPVPGAYRVTVIEQGEADTSAVTVTAPPPPQTCTGSATTICPGDSWQAKVTAAGTGTVFTIGAGVHRLQSVVAKQGQQFVAQPGAVMSGAKLLTGWTASGSTWFVGGQTQEFGHTTGVCQSGSACQYPEDVYRDDVLLRRELSLGAVGAGDFYFDYAADRIYVGDDPAGHKLEGAATEYAFLGSPDGSGQGVVIDGLTVEKYANAAQYGAIGRSNTQRGWIIRNAIVRWNHGAGIRIGAIQVLGGRVYANGQIGMVGGFDNTTLIRDVEVDHNNTAKFAADWEGGGIKFGGGLFSGVRVIKANIHDNDGIGLWADGYCDQFVWDSNTVVNNTWDGIKVEISYGGKVRDNVVTGNGFANPNSVEGDGIMVYAAGGTGLEISGNRLSGNKHGIMLFAADRGTGPGGPLVTQNVSVHDNDVTLAGSQRTGAERYSGSTGLWTTDNNHFEHNTYRLTGAPAAPFLWTNNALLTEGQWAAAGNDETGTFVR